MVATSYPEAVSELRDSCLGLVESVDMSESVSGVVRRMLDVAESETLEETAERALLVEAFELCVGTAGAVPWSLPLWRAYHSFVESWPTSLLGGDESRSQALKHVLERGVFQVRLLEGARDLWHELELLMDEESASYTVDEGGIAERVAVWKDAVVSGEWTKVIDWELGSVASNREEWVSRVVCAYRAAVCHSPTVEMYQEFAEFVDRRNATEATLYNALPCGRVASGEIYRLALKKHPENAFLAAATIKYSMDTSRLGESEASHALREAWTWRREGRDAARAVYHDNGTKTPVTRLMHWAIEWFCNGDSKAAESALDQDETDLAYLLSSASFSENRGLSVKADLTLLRAKESPGKISATAMRASDEAELWIATARVANRLNLPLGALLCKMAGVEPDGVKFNDFFWLSIFSSVDWSRLDWSWIPKVLDRCRGGDFAAFADGRRLRPSFLTTILGVDPVSLEDPPDVPQEEQTTTTTTAIKVGLSGRNNSKKNNADLPKSLASFCEKLPRLRPAFGHRDRVEFVLSSLSRLPLEQMTNLKKGATLGDQDDDDEPPSTSSDIFKRRRKAQLKRAKI